MERLKSKGDKYSAGRKIIVVLRLVWQKWCERVLNAKRKMWHKRRAYQNTRVSYKEWNPAEFIFPAFLICWQTGGGDSPCIRESRLNRDIPHLPWLELLWNINDTKLLLYIKTLSFSKTEILSHARSIDNTFFAVLVQLSVLKSHVKIENVAS